MRSRRRRWSSSRHHRWCRSWWSRWSRRSGRSWSRIEQSEEEEESEKEEKEGLGLPPGKGSVTDWQKILYHYSGFAAVYRVLGKNTFLPVLKL